MPKTRYKADKSRQLRRSWRDIAEKKAKRTRRLIHDAAAEIPDPLPYEEIAGLLPGYDPYKDASDFVFDADRAAMAVGFIQCELIHVKGKRGPFLLEPWQQAVVQTLWGWVDAEGLRRYRECLLYIPRKNGKTPLCAALLMLALFTDNEPTAEIYGAASEKEQASLVFDWAKGMVLANDMLSEQVQVYKSYKVIQLHEDDSTYRVIASKDSAAHGFNVHVAVVDELHTQKNRDLVDALMTGMAARQQPLMMHLTTADYERDGSVCNLKHDYAMGVIRGEINDPRFLPIVYQAPADCQIDDRDAWRQANPNLGVSVSESFLDRECQRAQDEPIYENVFRRLHLNQRTQQDVRWLKMDDWDRNAHELDLERLKGRRCFGGLDVGASRDLTALSLLFPFEDHCEMLWWFWAPEHAIEKRSREDSAPYAVWQRQKLIRFNPGKEVDYDNIVDDVAEICGEYDVYDIGIDDLYQGKQLASQLRGRGVEVVSFKQTMPAMSGPTREFVRMLGSDQLWHGGNPVARWMAGNVVVRVDEDNNVKVHKGKSTDRVDGIVAAIMAVGRKMEAPERRPSVYETRGVLQL